MATRKFLYGGASGYSIEQDPADDIALGGLAMSGNVTMGTNKVTGLGAGSASGDALSYGQASASLAGLSIDTNPLNMNSQQITNVGDGTVSHHAVNLGQLQQAVITGGTIKELLVHEDQVDNTEGVLAASILYMSANPVSGDTIILTDGTTTRTYGAGSGGDVQYTIGATPADSMQNLVDAINADGSAIWTASLTTDLDAINATVVAITEDDNDGTASEIYGVWGTQANCQIVDYTDEAQYNKKTSSNLPSSDPAATNFGIRRTQADLAAGELHYVENNDTIYGWDDDADQWNIMSGTASIPDATSASGGGIKGKVTFDRDFGLSVTTGIAKISVAANKGLSFDGSGDLQGVADTTAGMEVGANGFGIDIAASNPGVGFDGSGDLEAKADTTAGIEITATGIAIDIGVTNPGVGFDGSGDLEAKVVATGGIEKAATGLQVKIDDTPDTLDVGANGLKVVGVPSLFKVAGTAVGVTVTAPNFDTLTDGSNADSLHTHSGADEAKTVENAFTATENVTLGDPVYIDDQGNAVSKSLASSDTKFDTIGVAKTTVTATNPVDVVSLGPCDVLSGATAGNRYYLAAAGGLSTSIPAAGNWVVRVGWAMDANTLFVMPMPLHKRFA